MLDVQIARKLGNFHLDATFRTDRHTGVLAIAGVSGAGKSSVLRCIAGLERPTTGRIVVGERVLFDAEQGIRLPVHKRRLGVVFQDSRLFPHLSVQSNLNYGRPTRRPPTFDTPTVVSLLGIGHLLDRRPAALSGGERQRVAIGRALLSSPDLLLMDEPLASLDPARKQEVLPFLAHLPRKLSVPIVYVTHSIDEILQLADELVVMEAGRVVAQGPVTRTIPALAGLDGLDTVLEGTVTQQPKGPRVRVAEGVHLHVLGLTRQSPEHRVRLRISADDVMLAAGAVPSMSVRNRLWVTVQQIDATTSGTVVTLGLRSAPAVQLKARVSQAAVQELHLAPGQALTALVKAASIRVPGVSRPM